MNTTDNDCCNNLPGGEPFRHPLDNIFRVCGDDDLRLIRALAPCSRIVRKITLVVITDLLQTFQRSKEFSPLTGSFTSRVEVVVYWNGKLVALFTF